MRVEAPRLSEQPVLPSFPTVTSLPSKDKERPPHLSGDAEGKGPPMKKRKRFSLAWLALLALAGGVELLIVDGTLSGGAPLSRMAQRAGNAGPNTHPSQCGLSADVHLERRIRGHAHQRNAASQAAHGQGGGIPVLAAPPAAPPEPVAPLDIPSLEHQPSAAELEKAAAEARKMLQQQVEQLQKERGQLEKQLYRARATGDGYAQIRFRTLLEQNREALEKLIPKQ